MKRNLHIAVISALLSLPLASNAADQTKKKSPFTAADTNGDGKISPAEYVAAMKGKMEEAEAQARFAALDQNKDGTLNRTEFGSSSRGKGAGKKKPDKMPDGN